MFLNCTSSLKFRSESNFVLLLALLLSVSMTSFATATDAKEISLPRVSLPARNLLSVAKTPATQFAPFVGSWWVHGRLLVFRQNGTATYIGRIYRWCDANPRPCDYFSGNTIINGLNQQLKFTRVVGNTAYGVVISGTGDWMGKAVFDQPGSPMAVTFKVDPICKQELVISDGVIVYKVDTSPLRCFGA